ncbi:MAG: hypothetical protein AABM67_02850 [Acidobacteriota bacterium]
MRRLHLIKLCLGFGMMIMIGSCSGSCNPPPCPTLPSTCPSAPMTPICNWGVAANAPTVWPASTQVMMMPTAMNFSGSSTGSSQVAFVSFENANDINADQHGVLRIIDGSCHEIARFPDTSIPPPVIPPSCLAAYPNLNTVPHLSPGSGLALGDIDGNPADVEIVGVLDDHTTRNGGVIAFHLVGNSLVPLWCSSQLPVGDFLPRSAAPAIAQLDKPPAPHREIILDNKVFDFNGILRYSGFSGGGNDCASAGGPCPRSHTPIVANLLGPASLPQVITGRGIYSSSTNLTWTGPASSGNLPIINPNVSNSSPGLTYPAVADLNLDGTPEIIVTDTMTNTIWVLSPSGATLASVLLPVAGCPGAGCPCPGPGCPKCGGPPVIGNFDGILGAEIGVASCNSFTVFKYNPSGSAQLTQLWSAPTNDPGGQTTAALLNTPVGPRLYYADARTLWVFNGNNGNVLQCAINPSETAIESPIIAALSPGQGGPARLIVAANNYPNPSCGQPGIRIFDTGFGARSFWNQHTYHWTNVTNNSGAIPVVEPPNWVSSAPNTYRSQ